MSSKKPKSAEQIIVARLKLSKRPVLTSVLFRLVRGASIDNRRKMQQYIGAVAARYNKKTASLRIVVGNKADTRKGKASTYKLSRSRRVR